MATILKHAKRAAQASNRHSAVRSRLRVALSMQTKTLPADDALAASTAHARRYRPRVVAATQDLSTLLTNLPTRPLAVSITDGAGNGVAGSAQFTTCEWHGAA
ncbi:hypothetical protein [Paraburkholderia sp. XV]|uniref:hypothetical protein n=1 Tax=Paraburkholderia sp. XV TaxID=2831520 RepID=UPI001CD253FE|nr:hypothetical protein [Paraburkholderia sp. XV]